MPLGVYRLLQKSNRIFVRTKEHPSVKELEEEGLLFSSFDSIYESEQNFDEVYEKITNRLMKEVEEDSLVYAVPGHPLVAEKTVQLLFEKSKGKCDVKLFGGQSFLDALFQSVQIDPIEGFQLLDGTSLRKEDIQPTQHCIIGQIYDTFTASSIKLELMEVYPDDYEVYLITRAGTKGESVQKIPLYMLDRDFQVSNLTSLYIPPVQKEDLLYKRFSYLREVIATLRGPNGCPWDRKQTHETLKKYLLEEAYELLAAIDEKDDVHIVEELGDVLLQVMLHAQIGEDAGYFTIDDVIETLVRKMIRRHPHVFGDRTVVDADEVVKNWQEIKESERDEDDTSLTKKIPKGLPAFIQAFEIQKEASKFGFDWEEVDPVFEKVAEELKELKAALKDGMKTDDIKNEMGDVLFSVINLARHLSIHPEEALFQTNRKFLKRFAFIEEEVKKQGKSLQHFTLEELDHLWEEAKKQR
ncbi:nucleoside triphosphate pyrophosphohydrolase [Fervidibacillus halotolerans]|uniref:Nucleoside triphosphate pyrophosphohydrolase n=1 Tax=Fervidibacillus halotolerans TaxID=2980027 RepID=A0A9E8M2Q6_9BACI|nr:nucleoside triphosphate pyrophosphohydrolase [Fervidibacillus halotolerans]WAA14002.1 nucleoside triphosphate pyrophosphohydrolase [Fervidibacillus halotolerans]